MCDSPFYSSCARFVCQSTSGFMRRGVCYSPFAGEWGGGGGHIVNSDQHPLWMKVFTSLVEWAQRLQNLFPEGSDSKAGVERANQPC